MALFDQALEVMKSKGAVVVDPVNLPNAAWNDTLPLLLLEYEFKADLNAYLKTLGSNAPIKTLADIIDFNEKNRDTEMPFFGQERMHSSQSRGPLTDEAYLSAARTIQKGTRQDGIDALIAKDHLDALVAPTCGPAWVTDHVVGDRFDGGMSAGPPAIAGYPDIGVPMGFLAGLPVGISFFAGAWTEPTLIRLAYAFEQATNHRRPPTFKPTVG
jgi:amidase